MKEFQYFSDILGKLVELIPYPFEVESCYITNSSFSISYKGFASVCVDDFIDVVTEVLNNSGYKNSYSYKVEVSGKDSELHSVCRVFIDSVTNKV